jgi:Tol biopolymer transport system component
VADAKIVLDELPDDLQQEVVDFAEFLLAKARTRRAASTTLDTAGASLTEEQGQGDGPWASLLNSLGQFSDDYMIERCQPCPQGREAM